MYPTERSPIRIEVLADHPALVPVLSRWHHDQWGHLYGDAWTAADALAELASHGRTYPVTLIALRGAELVGSVSAIPDDVPGHDHLYAPWLASLYVHPDHRGAGIGARLVAALDAHMATLGWTTLHLVTPEHRAWYEQLGWRSIGLLPLGAAWVDLMRRDLPHAD